MKRLYGSSFNYHYAENGYHPIFMFEGETGDCLKAALRGGSVYISRQIVSFVGPELKRLRKKYPDIKILFVEIMASPLQSSINFVNNYTLVTLSD